MIKGSISLLGCPTWVICRNHAVCVSSFFPGRLCDKAGLQEAIARPTGEDEAGFQVCEQPGSFGAQLVLFETYSIILCEQQPHVPFHNLCFVPVLKGHIFGGCLFLGEPLKWGGFPFDVTLSLEIGQIRFLSYFRLLPQHLQPQKASVPICLLPGSKRHALVSG